MCAEAADEHLDIVLTAAADDPVELIAEGIVDRVDPPKPRRGPLVEPAQLMLAGSISLRILSEGVLDWARRVKDTTIYVDLSEPKAKVFKEADTPFASRVLVIRPDGTEANYPVDTTPANIEAALRVDGE